MCKSMDHWLSLEAEWTGFSYRRLRRMISCLGDGDRASSASTSCSICLGDALFAPPTQYVVYGMRRPSMADDRNAAFRRAKPVRHADSELGRHDPRVSGDSLDLARYHHPRFTNGRCLSGQRGPPRRRHPICPHHEPGRRTLPRSLRSWPNPQVMGIALSASNGRRRRRSFD